MPGIPQPLAALFLGYECLDRTWLASYPQQAFIRFVLVA